MLTSPYTPWQIVCILVIVNIADFKQTHAQKIRFVVVGGANTVLDFGIFFALSSSWLSPIPANYISTSVAMVSSFLINKKYTFHASGKKLHHEIALFLLFSIIGLWVLQPVIIWVCNASFGSRLPHWMLLLISKTLATSVSMVWNYMTYSRYVFTVKSS
jgi:putative flippase GtrA